MADEFEPRRAEPGTEFTYTRTERTKLDDDEDLPEGATLAVDTLLDGTTARRFAVREGVQRTLRADDDGVVHPKDAQDVAALDGFGLSVARKALAESRASEAPKKAEKAEG